MAEEATFMVSKVSLILWITIETVLQRRVEARLEALTVFA